MTPPAIAPAEERWLTVSGLCGVDPEPEPADAPSVEELLGVLSSLGESVCMAAEAPDGCVCESCAVEDKSYFAPPEPAEDVVAAEAVEVGAEAGAPGDKGSAPVVEDSTVV